MSLSKIPSALPQNAARPGRFFHSMAILDEAPRRRWNYSVLHVDSSRLRPPSIPPSPSIFDMAKRKQDSTDCAYYDLERFAASGGECRYNPAGDPDIITVGASLVLSGSALAYT